MYLPYTKIVSKYDEIIVLLIYNSDYCFLSTYLF